MEEKRWPTMREIGKIGGRRTADLYGHEHYVAMGSKGGQRVREMIKNALDLEKADGKSD